MQQHTFLVEDEPRPLRVFAFSCTDVGKKRSNNQDSVLVARDLNLFAVADGMGGYQGGEVASALAVDILEQAMRQARVDPVVVEPPEDAPIARSFGDALRAACRAIWARGQSERALEHMGTTTTALMYCAPWAFVAHVGDSRCYVMRDGAIRQLSHDHSLVGEQIRAGVITPEAAESSPFRHIITRALGTEPDVTVDLLAMQPRAGDVFLLCSDGLTGLVSDEEINAVTFAHDVRAVPSVLVDLANERGGTDNISVVLAVFVDAAFVTTTP